MKNLYRIISFILCIAILINPLSVFASGDDTVTDTNIDTIIENYKGQIKEKTVEFFNEYKVEVDGIDTLFDGFISTWKITKASAYYGLSYSKLVGGLLKDFISYLRDNYFYGYFENDVEIHYISPQGKLPSHGKPSPHSQSTHNPSDNFQPYPGVTELGFTGIFPFTNVSNYNRLKNIDFGFPKSTLGGLISSGDVGFYMWTSRDSSSLSAYCSSINGNNYIGYLNCNNNGTYIQYYELELLDHKLYYNNPVYGNNQFGYASFSNNSITNTKSTLQNNLSYWPSPQYRTALGSPIDFHGQREYQSLWGNFIIYTSSYLVLYYQNQFINCQGLTGTDSHGNYIDLSSTIVWDTKYIDNGINNFYTVINNIENNYPSITPDLLLYIIQDYLSKINIIDYSEYLEELADRISILEENLQQELEDIQNIKSTLVKVKNYLKNIDSNLTALLLKIDSMFNNSGILILDAKLDYVYNHLSADLTSNTNRIINAINNISVSGGGGDVNIDFSDYFIDFDASLNVLFSLNNEQKLEIESDLDDIKAPFKWIGNMTDGVKTLYKKMIVRSSAYNGGSSGDIDNVNSLNKFMDSSISQNGTAADQTTDSSVGGSASVPTLQAPVIYLHFNNATSSINYGGDVVALDFSWYAIYKNTVDTIIVAFCWAVFIFNMIKHVPSLIRGEDKGE